MTSPDRDSETPRTANRVFLAKPFGKTIECVIAELAFELERELNAANAEIADLKAKLATARDDALDEAIEVCEQRSDDGEGPDCWGWHAKDYAKYIRSLKSSSGGVRMKPCDADWKGAIKKRFRWSKFRFEYGRWCYRTNCFGETLDMCFEWETP